MQPRSYIGSTKDQPSIATPGRILAYWPDRRPVDASAAAKHADALRRCHAAHLARLDDTARAITEDTWHIGGSAGVARDALAAIMEQVRRRLPGRLDRPDRYPPSDSDAPTVDVVEAVDRVCIDL